MKTLLVIGAGRLQVPAFHCARALGLRIIAVDRNPNAPGMALADKAYTVDTHDEVGIVSVARAEKVDGVLTLCTDMPVRAVAAVGADLGLNTLSRSASLVATHKARMRERFAQCSVPIPRFALVDSLEAAARAAALIGLPVILKPPESSGSRGIFKLADLRDIERGYSHAKTIAGDEPLLVEEFVDGPEVSVETISYRGCHHVVAITDKTTTGDPHWIETGHAQPSRLPAAVQGEILKTAKTGLESLGIDNSAGHVEIKIGRSGPRIMEIGARLGGDFITTELTPRSTGVNMVEAIIRIALGEEPNLAPSKNRGAAIRYLVASPGRVTGIEGTHLAAAFPGVARLEVDVQVGDEVVSVASSLDRAGFVICEGADAASAAERARVAATAIRIHTSFNTIK